MLVDHADAVCESVLGRGYRYGLSVDENLPFIGKIDAGKHIHQRRLARSVFSEKRHDDALVQI